MIQQSLKFMNSKFSILPAAFLQALLFVLILNLGCSTSQGPDLNLYMNLPPTQRPYQLNGIWYYPIPSAEGYLEEGIASWYGKQFHGKPTSSGKIFDMHKISAAHKTLPLGTCLKVTNLQNGKNIVLRVNDRGPFVSGRIIDLSFKAAEMLDMVAGGTAPVRIEAVRAVGNKKQNGSGLPDPEPLPDFRHGHFVIQVGAFNTLLNAIQLKADLTGKYEKIMLRCPEAGSKKLYRVQVGIFNDLLKARREITLLKKAGHKGSFIVAVDNITAVRD